VFSRSLVAIFIPIFLLQIGYLIEEVIIYYFLFNLINVPLNFFARWLTRKIGARRVVILGLVFSVAFFIGLYSLGPGNWPLLIAIAALAAFYDAFYWVAHYFLFIKSSKHDDNISKDRGRLLIVRRVAGILAPAFGAVVLIFYSQQALILISIIILVVSIIPLFRMKDVPDKPRRKQVNFRKFFQNWNVAKDYISIGFYGVNNVTENIMWPIFIFLLFGSIESVAALPIIISITTIIFTLYVGGIKKSSRAKVIAIGSFFVALTWILRLLVDNEIFYFVSVFLIGLFSVLVSIPLDSNICEKGEKRDTLTASTYRNTFSMFFQLLFFGILIIFINVFHVSFIIAAVSMFLLTAVYSIFSRSLSAQPERV